MPGLLRFPGEGNGYPLQYSGLENFMKLQSMCHKLDTTERLSFKELWMHLHLVVALLDGKHWMSSLLFHMH